ncbi:bifunctional diaminohydroxyphosphoribosylaminopyrimidine deaminase/5-amino-6-(5-phosphoribosylamino)uracil reductase RibD [Dermacoccus nishinomiyaensis]|uniref:bifunctional diaminohydroxyphosphoribosylaminopyrimidine deaminase/5-amino-6-(5-phosphoribosylamino)uracil reductase RibD n=2 Tax=Dermacoccaceae TaxID=145357 RepID=UPI00093B0BCA|nr:MULTISPECIES: bifunctional diaminohydroxyphosphoribosylaminopyrimidine deaminase/5-amino-6-(5-phosphoribosylamino)uracil reductase RibD [Dermacoccus]MBO1757362.1 bifunctional diaminohydroxyphosphoribosylaminopyrimidine deaminase/5-amino-6-(5-phosphoribosylamino)uracil reductase RibD [Dermacoccus sp. NHGro5]TCJ91836.1 diaminohydroxyphosphoribosylaminopyrimidine deaminase/5-amino-6-(5-phosphoribosylamino)uracil reductase [Dermacoccus sp. SAI-028]TJZ97325.1 bifunctional diaminohydroxyphosphoribo
MERAAQLAALSPRVDPNPRVGCVVVDADGVILAEGYHRGAGTWHAEAAAINEAIATGVDLRSATAYVTLEPCAHTGRTPSCARALIRAGVARVVFGQPDPNGAAAGGAQILREAGVAVEQHDTLAAASQDLNADWTFSVTHARPFVRWKYASTLDGFSAASDGTSQWITGPVARVDVHAQRAEHGAIVVGTGTVLVDDPQLTVRDAQGRAGVQQPLRVVVGDTPIPGTARVLDDAASTLVLPRQSPTDVLAALHARGIHAVWLEGGPTLAAGFLRAGLVDEIVAYLAPALLGAGRPAAADLGITTIAEARRFDLVDATTLPSNEPSATDLRLRLRPTKEI